MRFEFVEEYQSAWSIHFLCELLKVSRSGFYAWRKREPSNQQKNRREVLQEVQLIHSEISQDYGSPRVHSELTARGYYCCENTVARIMKEGGIKARSKRKFRIATTDSKHDFPIAPNLLKQEFSADQPDSVWLTDITYISTRQGTTYLCTILDLYSRRIIGWQTSRSMHVQLVLDALQQAIDLRDPSPGLIVHSDRGSQFASLAFQTRLDKYGIVQSMSRKGNCYDNAPMESFFRSFKVEEVYWDDYHTHRDATQATCNYIERFYNRTRRHSSLGYISPIDFEKKEVGQMSC